MSTSSCEDTPAWLRAYNVHGRNRSHAGIAQLTSAQMLLRILRYLYGYLCACEADYEVNERDHSVLRSWLVVREVPRDWRDKSRLLRLRTHGDALLRALYLVRELMRREFIVTQRDDEDTEHMWHSLFSNITALAYDDQRSARAIWLEDVVHDDVHFYETQKGQGDY